MKELKLYYATNRNHCGDDQWNPTGYGTEFSKSEGAQLQNLRFGCLTLKDACETEIKKHLDKEIDGDKGDGKALTDYFRGIVGNLSTITAYKEDSNNLGSKPMFHELKQAMEKSSDVLIYIHGFNTDWWDSVASALALQETLNQRTEDKQEKILVVLFSWPSNGLCLPCLSYYNDRSDASSDVSGRAFARGMLKLRDYLSNIKNAERCQRKIHLLCHSMGNFVLQHSLKKMIDLEAGALPRIFDYIFMCAPDVDSDVFNKDMKRLPELTRRISIYCNEEDMAMTMSDMTKGNPDRLGHEGVDSLDGLSNKIHQINCTEVVGKGLIEHNYYLNGLVNKDIRLSLLGFSACHTARNRKGKKQTNSWELVKKNATCFPRSRATIKKTVKLAVSATP